MKQNLHPLSALLLALSMLLFGCDKGPITKGPVGQPFPLTNIFQVVVENLPGLPQAQHDLYAVFSVVNAQQPTIVHQYKTPLTYKGRYFSDTVTLTPGDYIYNKLIIVDAQGKAVFAAPISGSAKASQVQQPLTRSFALPRPDFLMLITEVLRIENGETPQQYGYPDGSFTYTGGDNNTPNSTGILVQAIIKVGDIVYDSIPALLQLTTWDAAGQTSTRSITLAAGKNNIALPNAATKYRLATSRWGISDEMILEKNDVQAGTLYVLGGSKAAKKLKSEISYTQHGLGDYEPLSKNVYDYNSEGKLHMISYYLRKADNTPYLAYTDEFIYNATGQVEHIEKLDETYSPLSTTTFTYNQAGKLINVLQLENDERIQATVKYLSQPGSVGIANYNVYVKYHFRKQNLSTDYHLNFEHGNNVQDLAVTSLQSTEAGTYVYDFNINPYAHMNWPDLYLRNAPINNRIQQFKQFTGNYPSAVSHQVAYTYDSEGYPKEKLETFYSYPNNAYSHKIKTVYTY
ncbi:MAG TPA: hypothetical protein VLC98_00370 [Phnomibacter sp.]|nr:hypothetical protein [Phnomibacter sp.]